MNDKKKQKKITWQMIFLLFYMINTQGLLHLRAQVLKKLNFVSVNIFSARSHDTEFLLEAERLHGSKFI